MQVLNSKSSEDEKIAILLVDDEEFNLEITGELLEDAGYCVDTALNGIEACACLQNNPDKYAIILLDRMMPEMDGIEVLHYLSGHPSFSSIPVVMQTAKATKADVQEGVDAGALFYLTKPFSEATLLHVVDSAIHNSMTQKVLRQAVAETGIENNNKCEFKFKTLDEARNLSIKLANMCPNPKRVVVGFVELLINAVEHGNLNIGFNKKTELLTSGAWEAEVIARLKSPENMNKFVRVTVEKTDVDWRFTIADGGGGFEHLQYLTVDTSRACSQHGRGIAIANMISFDELIYCNGGNTVTAVVKKLQG